jgi:hypothetical protein
VANWLLIDFSTISARKPIEQPVNPKTKTVACQTALRTFKGAEDEQCPSSAASSTGRCNTIWYKAVFKGGVYGPRETGGAFCGAEERHVVPLEGGTVVA